MVKYKYLKTVVIVLQFHSKEKKENNSDISVKLKSARVWVSERERGIGVHTQLSRNTLTVVMVTGSWRKMQMKRAPWPWVWGCFSTMLTMFTQHSSRFGLFISPRRPLCNQHFKQRRDKTVWTSIFIPAVQSQWNSPNMWQHIFKVFSGWTCRLWPKHKCVSSLADMQSVYCEN